MKRLAALLLAVALALTPRAPAATAEPDPGGPALVNFNFEQAELRLLVRLVGEMTGRRFVVDDELKGRVTVLTPERIPVSQAYDLLVSILESSGFSVVEQGGTYRVVRLPAGGLLTGAVVVDGGAGGEGLITKVLRIQHVGVSELKKLLEPLVRGGKEGALAAFPPTNHLIVTDTAERIRQLERIIAELDRPGASRSVEVFNLKHASAEELARQLQSAMKGVDSAGEKVARHLQQVGEGMGSLPTDLMVVPVPKANQLVAVGAPTQVRELAAIIARLDVEPASAYNRLHVLFLNYLPAEEAAKSLNALLAKTVQKDRVAEVAIEHHVAKNALIIHASPSDFDHLARLVGELDTVPQQVMVEVLIAEVQLGKQLDLGVQLSQVDTPSEGNTTFIGRNRPGESDYAASALESGTFPQGLAVAVARGTYTASDGSVLPSIPIILQALQQDRDVKILSSVPLWAQNNAEATVSVVENIPVLRSTIEGGSGTARDVIQNIDRLDVGIKLKVTPQVNPNGEITLKLNPSIEAITDEGPSDTQFAPTIAKREVSTTVTISNGSTVVISGLIREDRVETVSKVPWLGDLPLIGFFFRSRSDTARRTNLLIFVTPHLVTSSEAAAAMQKKLELKTGLEPVVPDPKPVSGKKG